MNLQEKINSIGASYLVSFLYGKYIDKSHKAYLKRATDMSSAIESIQGYYYDSMCTIAAMNENRLNGNELGLSGADVVRMAADLKAFFAGHSAVTFHLKSADGELTLKDLSDCAGWINDAILQFKQEAMYNEQDALDDAGAVIQDVRNGSVDCTFLVSVGAQVAAGLILKIGEYLWEKVKEKYNKRNDQSASDMVDPEANKINIII